MGVTSGQTGMLRGRHSRESRNQMSFVRPLPIYGIWCKDFEEAIKFIFCQEMTIDKSPDLANKIKKNFFLIR